MAKRPLHGYVYLITNLGTDEEPSYSDSPVQLLANGSVIDVFGWPSPNFADFDSDGDLDLLCGEFLDGFTYFENQGTRQTPRYGSGRRLNDQTGKPLVMDLQMITPTAIDWDRDGDMDLIVGDEDGRVAWIQHTGRIQDGLPIFAAPIYFQQQADTLKFGALATPFAFDWDRDGDEDILCGNTAGYIGWFENLGDVQESTPKWSAPKRLEVRDANGETKTFRIMAGTSGSIQGPAEAKWGYTCLSVADWDRDHDPDILYASIFPQLRMLRNDQGTLVDMPFSGQQPELSPRWYWDQRASRSQLSSWRTTPYATDFNDDGLLDLVMLDQEGYLTLRSAGGVAERLFIDEDNQLLRLNAKSCGASGRVKLCVVDWDGDGRRDLLVDSANATWYRNCEDREGRYVMKRIGQLADRDISGHTASPAICDFDHDGKPDLLLGSESGRIYHLAHDHAVTFSENALKAREPAVAPEPRFEGWVSEEMIFDKLPTPQCHASTICETSRGLVAAWFGGTQEGHKDVGIWTSYFDGGHWSHPTQVANGVQHHELRYPCWNPVLFQSPGDGPTFLFFKVGPSPSSWWGEVMVSYDRGRTFRDRKRLPESIDGPVRCKPLLINHQRLLCGSSTEHDGWRVHFESIDLLNGTFHGTWKRVGPIASDSNRPFNAIQPTLLRHPDGRLQALCRTKERTIVSTESSDDGASWSDLKPLGLPNPNSGIDAVGLNDGRFLLIYNHLDGTSSQWGTRGMLNLALSDDGLLWNRAAVIEQQAGSEFSYPAIIQTSDGMVHMSYTWKRTQIKHIVIDPAKLRTGDPLGPEAW